MKKFLLLMSCFTAIVAQSQQWVIKRPFEEGVILRGGDCNGIGNYIVGNCNNVGKSGYTDAYAMYVNNDGEYVEKTFRHEGYRTNLCAAIGLDDGNAFVVGIKGGTLTDIYHDTLWISVMTPELEIVEEHNYPLIEPYKTWTSDVYLAFNNYGEIIVLADVSEKDYPMITNGVYAVFKCDTHGNILKSKYFAEGHGVGGARPTGIIRVPDSDMMMLLGQGFSYSNYHSICYIDNDLEKVNVYQLPWKESIWNYTDYWKPNGHFLMSSTTFHQGATSEPQYAAVFEVDDRGRYIDTLVYDRPDTADYTAQFGSMAYAGNDDIFIATFCQKGVYGQMTADAVICLIDSDLNLKGTKRLKDDGTLIRILRCCRTSDGGCLVFGQCPNIKDRELLCVWKLLPEDFILPWTLNDNPEVSPHHEAYPNPTSGYFNVILDNEESQNVVVSITGEDGCKYFERRLEARGKLTVDVSSLENGAYFYEITTKGRSIRKGKFIKY